MLQSSLLTRFFWVNIVPAAICAESITPNLFYSWLCGHLAPGNIYQDDVVCTYNGVPSKAHQHLN